MKKKPGNWGQSETAEYFEINNNSYYMYLYLTTLSGLVNKIIIILHTNTSGPILADHYTKTCILYHNNTTSMSWSLWMQRISIVNTLPNVKPEGNSSFISKRFPKMFRNSNTIIMSPNRSDGSFILTGVVLGNSCKWMHKTHSVA